MSDASLSRYAGPIAVAAGGFVAVVDLGRFLLWQDDPVAMLADPAYLAFNGCYFLAFPALLIALVAVHGRQAREARGSASSRPARPTGCRSGWPSQRSADG